MGGFCPKCDMVFPSLVVRFLSFFPFIHFFVVVGTKRRETLSLRWVDIFWNFSARCGSRSNAVARIFSLLDRKTRRKGIKLIHYCREPLLILGLYWLFLKYFKLCLFFRSFVLFMPKLGNLELRSYVNNRRWGSIHPSIQITNRGELNISYLKLKHRYFDIKRYILESPLSLI